MRHPQKTHGLLPKLLRLALAVLLTAPAAALAQPSTDYHVRTACNGLDRCFTHIQAALDAAERDPSKNWVHILIGPGEFREKLVLKRDRMRLTGAGAGKSRLSFDAVAEHSGRYDRDGWGTAGSATLTVAAKDVRISKLTVENSFDYLANRALPDGDPRKIVNSQALAVQLDSGSDRVLFDHVALLSYHDTLFTRGMRAVFRQGLIAGNVDFIFGNGMLLIENSIIRSRPRGARDAASAFDSFITAPSTPSAQPVGIVFYRSRLTREAGVPNGSVALGRPWHPTRTFPDGRYADPDAVGQASFIDCVMDAHIHADGWSSMAGTAPDGTKTRIFEPQDARFSESGSRGPGSKRRDIGLKWSHHPDIAAIRRIIFAGWPI